MSVGNPRGKYDKQIWILIILAAGFVLYYSVLPFFTRDVYDPVSDKQKILASSTATTSQTIEIPAMKHIATPQAVKGIYMSACAAGSQTFRTNLKKLIDTTEVNSIVIDIKDYTGTISFVPSDPKLQALVSKGCPVPDMKEYIATLHDSNIYVIGRITTFQDPYFARMRPDLAVKTANGTTTWHDRKGLSYLDPGAKENWDHIIAISKASYEIGFDELNYDYIRFPSDGNMADISYTWSGKRPKPEVLEGFFEYLHKNLGDSGIPISADLFGMVTTNYDDLNIGQVLERALPYFDYIDPMVYPSHYPPTYNGWPNPNAVPYQLISYTIGAAIKRTIATSTLIKTNFGEYIASTTPRMYTKEAYSKQKIRPWLQDFSLGPPIYGVAEVRAQIQATEDLGLQSWILWNAGNHYSAGALKPEASTTFQH
jgi:hypothetical protein